MSGRRGYAPLRAVLDELNEMKGHPMMSAKDHIDKAELLAKMVEDRVPDPGLFGTPLTANLIALGQLHASIAIAIQT